MRAEQQAVRRVGFVWGPMGVGCTPVIGRGGPKDERDMGHTFLCPGTIGKLGSANRVHELSSDRTDMGHSSSCRDMYHDTSYACDGFLTISCTPAGKLNNCVTAVLYRGIHTSLMNLFSSSASSNSSSTTVGFMFLRRWAVFRWKVKGTRNTTDATRFKRAS